MSEPARVPGQTARENLRMMLTIRRAEEKVISFATEHEGLIRGHYHVYIGQESSGVAACAALGEKDYVFTTHRNHGHLIARGGELGPVLAEIIARTAGYNGGRGGTFHVIAPHLGILQTSGVVGGCMPLAAGAAFSIKTRKTDQVSLVFFGDGVLEEGAFYEAINMSALWKLPIVFMCENNDVPKHLRKGGDIESSSLHVRKLTDIPETFGIPSVIVDGADMDAVAAVMKDAVARVRGGGGPVFVEARLTRWPGNAAAFPVLYGGTWKTDWAFDPAKGPKELQDWLQNSDPVSLYARACVERQVLSRDEIATMDREVIAAVEEAARFAVASPPRKAESALEHVFA
jgi:TPP-dependent pyruvate/acetoin dehydrogenase alpha subunit